MTEEFIAGLELSRRFYNEVVKGLLSENFQNLKYSVGLMGHGSEVLGFDTAISTDHDWGPRLILFLSKEDLQRKTDIETLLGNKLPELFLGFYVRPDNTSEKRKEEANAISKQHRIEITTIQDFFLKELGVDPYADLTIEDWLVLPSQRLLSVTRGEVFFDGLEELNSIRLKFSYYPHNVWLYIMATQWSRISEDDAFMGRTGDVGDEIGSTLVGGQLIRYVMELCFMMEKKYIPYPKWFGTAFLKLEAGHKLIPLIQGILSSSDWKNRESYFSMAYEFLAEKHNSLRITESLPVKVSSFFGRPYLVIKAGDFSNAIINKITDEKFKLMPLIGNVDQFIFRADIRDVSLLGKIKILFRK